jgi:hypothetical protein
MRYNCRESIGGINASIIDESKEDHSEKSLEQYWLELAENKAIANSKGQ